MSRPTVLKPAAIAALALVFGVSATPLAAQSNGVLQATARVVDYGTSLATLKAAGHAAQAYRLEHHRTIGGLGVQLSTAQQDPRYVARRAEPTVVTISYLH
jgi:hypothetical protein